MGWIRETVAGVIEPLTKIVTNRQARKAAGETAAAKLIQAKHDGSQEVMLQEQEIEAVRTAALAGSWKDEYITVSLGSILNLLVIGGIAAAFGYNQVLEGMSVALVAITAAGINIGELIEFTVKAAVGISVWRKFS